MQSIIKFGLTKAVISSTFHTAVRYGSRSIGGIIMFDPFVIHGTGAISILIKHYWKSNPSCPILWASLATI